MLRSLPDMTRGLQALTEKEKQTLRLIVRGYDAKSLARRLDISVHTVNERLRNARRKLDVSSSREAARMLVAREEEHPQTLVSKPLGEAMAAASLSDHASPPDGTDPRRRAAWMTGAIVMSLILAALALTTTMQAAPAASEPAASAETSEVAIVQSARDWLALVDAGRWDQSWNATGKAFKDLNTSAKWAEVSQSVRPPLGAAVSREMLSRESVPTPPHGNEIVKFRTSFANKPDALETVALVHEGGQWRVVGYWIG